MRKMILTLWLLSIVLPGLNQPVLAADQPANPLQNSPSGHISGPELLKMTRQGKPVTVIDVRSNSEYQAGHVPGAIHLPFWKAYFKANSLSAPRDQTLVLYCAHGPRAVISKGAFKLAGFEDIRYLDGHMTEWYKARLPVERPAKP